MLPRLINALGAGLRAVWTPWLELLMYPECLVTSGLRRSGRQPLPGTYGYGRLLGPSSRPAPGSASGSPPAGPPAGPALPWKTAFLVIACSPGCWYAAPRVAAGAPKTLLANINTDDTHVSTWIATGKWAPSPAVACTVLKARQQG